MEIRGPINIMVSQKDCTVKVLSDFNTITLNNFKDEVIRDFNTEVLSDFNGPV